MLCLVNPIQFSWSNDKSTTSSTLLPINTQFTIYKRALKQFNPYLCTATLKYPYTASFILIISCMSLTIKLVDCTREFGRCSGMQHTDALHTILLIPSSGNSFTATHQCMQISETHAVHEVLIKLCSKPKSFRSDLAATERLNSWPDQSPFFLLVCCSENKVRLQSFRTTEWGSSDKCSISGVSDQTGYW